MNAVLSIPQFKRLGFDAQASILSKYGEYLHQRTTENGARMLTFRLFDFYVEVSYRRDLKVQYIKTSERPYERILELDEVEMLHLN